MPRTCARTLRRAPSSIRPGLGDCGAPLGAQRSRGPSHARSSNPGGASPSRSAPPRGRAQHRRPAVARRWRTAQTLTVGSRLARRGDRSHRLAHRLSSGRSSASAGKLSSRSIIARRDLGPPIERLEEVEHRRRDRAGVGVVVDAVALVPPPTVHVRDPVERQPSSRSSGRRRGSSRWRRRWRRRAASGNRCDRGGPTGTRFRPCSSGGPVEEGGNVLQRQRPIGEDSRARWTFS